MAVTRIQTFGPREVTEDGLQRFEYYAEARGPDGRLYYATGRGRPTPFVWEQEHWREEIGKILEARMKEEGLWESA